MTLIKNQTDSHESKKMKKLILILFIVLSFGIVKADVWYDTIKASADDGICNIIDGPAWDVRLTDNTFYINCTGGTYGSGIFLRFTTCPIPDGATIDSVFVAFQSDEGTWGTCSTIVVFEDTADATTFSDSADFANRHWTTAVDSVPVPNADAYVRYEIKIKKEVLQEVIDRADWEENNDIALRTYKLSIGVYSHKILAYDYSTTLCSVIRVYYTTGGVVKKPQVIMIQ